jgi:hypothetical protein
MTAQRLLGTCRCLGSKAVAWVQVRPSPRQQALLLILRPCPRRLWQLLQRCAAPSLSRYPALWRCLWVPWRGRCEDGLSLLLPAGAPQAPLQRMRWTLPRRSHTCCCRLVRYMRATCTAWMPVSAARCSPGPLGTPPAPLRPGTPPLLLLVALAFQLQLQAPQPALCQWCQWCWKLPLQSPPSWPPCTAPCSTRTPPPLVAPSLPPQPLALP